MVAPRLRGDTKRSREIIVISDDEDETINVQPGVEGEEEIEDFADDADDDRFQLQSDEEDVPRRAGDNKPGDVARLLKGSLPVPFNKVASVESVNQRIRDEDIDLKAPYQRNVVWSTDKMEKLIQSMMLNYYIPPLIFAVEPTRDGLDEKLICIDGKQRCTSIRRFMAGQIPYISPYENERYWYAPDPDRQGANRRRGKPLPLALKKKFDQVQLTIVEYRGISELQQRDVFQRVQLGVTLRSAEILQAMPGHWSSWIGELYKKYVSEPGTLGDAFKWLQSRDQPFQNIASFVYMAYTHSHRVIPSRDILIGFLERDDVPERWFKRKVEKALTVFIQVAEEYRETAIEVVPQRVAPAEWVYYALVIYRRMTVLSLPRLAEALGGMRRYVRIEKGTMDVLGNAKVGAMFFEAMERIPDVRQPGEEPAAEGFEDEGGDDGDYEDVRPVRRMPKKRMAKGKQRAAGERPAPGGSGVQAAVEAAVGGEGEAEIEGDGATGVVEAGPSTAGQITTAITVPVDRPTATTPAAPAESVAPAATTPKKRKTTAATDQGGTSAPISKTEARWLAAEERRNRKDKTYHTSITPKRARADGQVSQTPSRPTPTRSNPKRGAAVKAGVVERVGGQTAVQAPAGTAAAASAPALAETHSTEKAPGQVAPRAIPVTSGAKRARALSATSSASETIEIPPPSIKRKNRPMRLLSPDPPAVADATVTTSPIPTPQAPDAPSPDHQDTTKAQIALPTSGATQSRRSAHAALASPPLTGTRPDLNDDIASSASAKRATAPVPPHTPVTGGSGDVPPDPASTDPRTPDDQSSRSAVKAVKTSKPSASVSLTASDGEAGEIVAAASPDNGTGPSRTVSGRDDMATPVAFNRQDGTYKIPDMKLYREGAERPRDGEGVDGVDFISVKNTTGRCTSQ